MPQSTYNQIPYETVARIAMHPDRMAAVARLFGMHPAPVDGCRYLEIGCGNGSHIVSLAHHLPQSRFVGVDLAEVPIAAGEKMRAALDIGNLTLRTADLRDIGQEWGSSITSRCTASTPGSRPKFAKARLRVCKERLAPAGVAFISYNALPGAYVRQLLRNLILFTPATFRTTGSFSASPLEPAVHGRFEVSSRCLASASRG